MGNISAVFSAMRKNFMTWKFNPRIYVILALLIVFHWYTFHDYSTIAAYLGVPISVCVFPFFVALGMMAFIFGAVPLLLYSEAPFSDHYAPFIVIRTGRRNWIIGQILYVFISSLIYTIVSVLMSIIVMLPNVQFELDWGQVMWTMALEPEAYAEAGVTIIAPWDVMMNAMSGLEAMLLSMLLYWLVTVFLGMVILCFNILIQKGVGSIIAGCLIGLSYFASVFGDISFGSAVLWLSPVSWRGYNTLALSEGSNLPTIPYAITVLSVSIIIMAVVSVIVFCKKDLEFEKGEY